MITTVKIVRAHAKALYWKRRVEKADEMMRKHLQILASVGSGKHETEHGFFQVSENNCYPEDAIKAQLTTDDIYLCHERRWSNKRAKVLFPTEYENAKVEKGFKVAI